MGQSHNDEGHVTGHRYDTHGDVCMQEPSVILGKVFRLTFELKRPINSQYQRTSLSAQSTVEGAPLLFIGKLGTRALRFREITEIYVL